MVVGGGWRLGEKMKTEGGEKNEKGDATPSPPPGGANTSTVVGEKKIGYRWGKGGGEECSKCIIFTPVFTFPSTEVKPI